MNMNLICLKKYGKCRLPYNIIFLHIKLELISDQIIVVGDVVLVISEINVMRHSPMANLKCHVMHLHFDKIETVMIVGGMTAF